MRRDTLLKWSGRPAATVGFTLPYLFPEAATPLLLPVSSTDMFSGCGLVARLDVTTSFSNTADTTAAFCVAVGTDSSLLADGIILVQGPALGGSTYEAGKFIELALPRLSPIHLALLQPGNVPVSTYYVGVGLVIAAASSDFTAGAADVHIFKGSGDGVAASLTGFELPNARPYR